MQNGKLFSLRFSSLKPCKVRALHPEPGSANSTKSLSVRVLGDFTTEGGFHAHQWSVMYRSKTFNFGFKIKLSIKLLWNFHETFKRCDKCIGGRQSKLLELLWIIVKEPLQLNKDLSWRCNDFQKIGSILLPLSIATYLDDRGLQSAITFGSSIFNFV